MTPRLVARRPGRAMPGCRPYPPTARALGRFPFRNGPCRRESAVFLAFCEEFP